MEEMAKAIQKPSRRLRSRELSFIRKKHTYHAINGRSAGASLRICERLEHVYQLETRIAPVEVDCCVAGKIRAML